MTTYIIVALVALVIGMAIGYMLSASLRQADVWQIMDLYNKYYKLDKYSTKTDDDSENEAGNIYGFLSDREWVVRDCHTPDFYSLMRSYTELKCLVRMCHALGCNLKVEYKSDKDIDPNPKRATKKIFGEYYEKYKVDIEAYRNYRRPMH